MLIDERSAQLWQLTNPGGNYDNNGYPTRIPKTALPNVVAADTHLQAAGDGVLMCGWGGAVAPRSLLLVPFGAGSSGNTFALKVLGWRPTTGSFGGTQKPALWVPVVLCTCAVTVGTGTGIAGADLTTTALFATTITMTGGPTFITSGAAPVTPDWFEISPTGNDIGMIAVRTFGFPFLEVIFTTGGSATNCNSLYAWL